jgi:hypothetical protein
MKRFQVSRWVSYKEYQYVVAKDIDEAERKAYRIKEWNETEHERCGTIDVTLAKEGDRK